jgi:hypothetical protein
MHVVVRPRFVVGEIDQMSALRACFEHCDIQAGLNHFHRGSAASGAGTNDDYIIDDFPSPASRLPSLLSPHRIAFLI